jgi:arsenical pump membrane protein
MHGLPVHTFFIWFISLASILCMLLRPWRIAEAVWIAAGAALLVVTRLISMPSAIGAVAKGTDVYLFLTGMMLSNDATAVVLTPAVLAAVRRADVEPKPYLLACALVANAASFVLPISNPANLVVYGTHIPALGPWLKLFLLPSVAAILVTYLCLHLLSRQTLRGKIHSPANRIELTPQGRLALIGLFIAAATLLIASRFGIRLGAPTCAAAVIAVLLVSFKDRAIFLSVVKDVSWSILPLVVGLFILVEALSHAGMLSMAQTALQLLLHSSQIVASLGAAFGAALLSNLMNNLPVGLASGAALAQTPIQTPAAHSLGHALLLGVDLGPNLSVTGSLATILWLIALRREKVEITARQFFKIGLIVMPAALCAAVMVQLVFG